MGYEGAAGQVYFSALSALLPAEAGSRGRERGGNAGAFNQMLNYGYEMLYQELLSLCGKARLDPYIGVMHTDGWNRPTLVYDSQNAVCAQRSRWARIVKLPSFQNIRRSCVFDREIKCSIDEPSKVGKLVL